MRVLSKKHLLISVLFVSSSALADTVDFCSTAMFTDRLAFEAYAHRDNFPGAMQALEVKFLITGLQEGTPQLYLMNTTNHPYHYNFAFDCLGWNMSLWTFNLQTYFTQDRYNLAGSIIAHDYYDPMNLYATNDTGSGLYTMEFWPTDPVHFAHIDLAYQMIYAAMPYAQDRLYYHAPGQTQQALFEIERDLFEASKVKVIETKDLFTNVVYTPLNMGESYGRLRVVQGPQVLSIQDIAVFETIPNTLSHVSGIITTVPQTPLSHVNLKAKQNHIPNAYIKQATRDPNILALDGQYVHYIADVNGYRIESADANEVLAYLDSVRPTQPQVPQRDLSLTNIMSLSVLGFDDSIRVGAKVANVAELGKILPTGIAPQGYAVPFYYYDEFMKYNGFYDTIANMMAQVDFQSNPQIRQQRLDFFRWMIRKRSNLPSWMMEALNDMHQSFPAETSLRCRSSTNNEDLPNFNGAGLYDSYTHHPDEGHIAKSMRQVWASLWTYRAFEEREFHRIDHLAAAMGVLVHPNYSNEKVNGVAVTKNIYDENWPGYYVNAQLGEDLVTNPEPNSIPDEFLVAELLGDNRYEIQYIRHTNLTEQGKTLLTNDQIYTLADMMGSIQYHFTDLYQDETMAMEIEFKITASGHLAIKQARPWIE